MALLPTPALAQQSDNAADVVGWLVPGLRWQPDSSRWEVSAAFNSTRNDHLRHPWVQAGLLQLGYHWPRLTLAGAYISGPVSGLGSVRLTQLHLASAPSRRRGQPRGQLTLDCLHLLPAETQGPPRPATWRVRTLVGLEPPLGRHLTLLLNTEPFVYRSTGWLQEVRSQAGLRWQPAPRLRLEAIYWNWWSEYEPRRVRWQHTLLLTATAALGTPPPAPVFRPLY